MVSALGCLSHIPMEDLRQCVRNCYSHESVVNLLCNHFCELISVFPGFYWKLLQVDACFNVINVLQTLQEGEKHRDSQYVQYLGVCASLSHLQSPSSTSPPSPSLSFFHFLCQSLFHTVHVIHVFECALELFCLKLASREVELVALMSGW